MTRIRIPATYAPRVTYIDRLLEQNAELTITTAGEVLDHLITEGKFEVYPAGRVIPGGLVKVPAYEYYRKPYEYVYPPTGKLVKVAGMTIKVRAYEYYRKERITTEPHYFPRGKAPGEIIDLTLTRKLFGYMYYTSDELRTSNTPTPFAFIIMYVYSFQPDDYPEERMRELVKNIEEYYWSLRSAIKSGERKAWHQYHEKSLAYRQRVAPAAVRKEVKEEREIDYPDDIVEMKGDMARGIIAGIQRVGLDEARRYVLLYDKTGGIKLEKNEEALEAMRSEIGGGW